MKKGFNLTLVIVLIFVSSILNVFSTNLLLTDLANNLKGFQDFGFIYSLSSFIFPIELSIIVLMLLRFYQNTNSKKKFYSIYFNIFVVFSTIGLLLSISSFFLLRDSLLTVYPYLEYGIFCLAIHTINLSFSIFARFYFVKQFDEDVEYKRITFKQVISSIGFVLFMTFAFNRFGTLLTAHSYMQISSLKLTWLFYLNLLTPMNIFFYMCLKYYSITLNRSPLKGALTIFNVICSLTLTVLNLILTFNNPLFVSAISGANGLERILLMPIVTLLQTLITLLFGIIMTIKLIKNRKLS